jgi:putative DeoR family transcriptional regulator (stage III sporulation protein D)
VKSKIRQTDEDREILLGRYIAETGATVRAAAEVFGISKSTVHKDITQKLSTSKPSLYKKVKKVLDKNKEERARRGGEATKKKYEKRKLSAK